MLKLACRSITHESADSILSRRGDIARRTRPCPPPKNRRGVSVVFWAINLVILLASVAFAVDVGYLMVARGQLQNSADSAAMSGAWEMLREARLKGGASLNSVMLSARNTAASYAGHNYVVGTAPTVDLNTDNDPSGDIVLGRLSSQGNITTLGNASAFNAIFVHVRRDDDRNGPIGMFFAHALGVKSVTVDARAIAIFEDGIVGFHATGATGNTSLLPFALSEDEWKKILQGDGPDQWSYDSQNGLTSNPDGLTEAKLFPAKQNKGSGLTPGNFGTVDIGSGNNSNADLQRQITEGVSADDLSYLGGQIKLGADGTLSLKGDTGVDASLALALNQVIGLPRTIPIYKSVTGSGNTATYTIVGFVGIRILDFDLSSADSYVTIQPAIVVDDSAISGGPTSNPSSTSYNVYQPVILVR